MSVPNAVPAGWFQSFTLEGETHLRLLSYPDGAVRFEHTCDRGDRGVIVCAPRLQLDGGHTITYSSDEAGVRPTVHPSIACGDCGLHGFVTNGRWITC